jgi:F0F1-type ATP synthase membrane subunit b/b'
MGELNLTLPIVLISFLVFVQLLKRVFFQPMAALFERRQAALGAIRSKTDELTTEYLSLELLLEQERANQRLSLRQQWEEAQQRIDTHQKGVLQEAQLQANEAVHEHIAAVLGQYQQASQHLNSTLDSLIVQGVKRLLPMPVNH